MEREIAGDRKRACAYGDNEHDESNDASAGADSARVLDAVGKHAQKHASVESAHESKREQVHEKEKHSTIYRRFYVKFTCLKTRVIISYIKLNCSMRVTICAKHTCKILALWSSGRLSRG